MTKGLDQALVQLRPALVGVDGPPNAVPPGDIPDQRGAQWPAFAYTRGSWRWRFVALLLLLLSLRFAFVCVVAIAMSLVGATAVLQGLGYTFSSIVLLGLLLALAVVVEDAVSSTTALMARLAKGKEKAMRLLPIASRVALVYREFGRTFVGGSVVALVCGASAVVRRIRTDRDLPAADGGRVRRWR